MTFAPLDWQDLAQNNSDQGETPIPLGSLDGRYRRVAAPLVNYFSEPALNRARIYVEIEWFIYLCQQQVLPGLPQLTEAEVEYLRDIVADFGPAEIAEHGEIEAVTVHDVKAVEYFITRRLEVAAEHLPGSDLSRLTPLVHFACTSEDINNLSYALLIQGGVRDVWLPAARALVEKLTEMAHEHKDLPMLAHTHGQPATPVTLGKELAVTAHRLARQVKRIEATEYLGKINGATGTFGAHVAAAPGVDWIEVSRGFVTGLGLTWNPLTTQIESHDWQSELYDDIARFNSIAHNLATDVWTYISMNYFTQIPVAGATGSSTMPHKINPIRFENGEANLEISNALFDVLSRTLITSRMQRDLTDSSSQRNIGTAFGHSLLALHNIVGGLGALAANPAAMAADLEGNWEVLGEAIQSAMRAAGIAGVAGMENPYERLKELTRGHRVGEAELREFVAGLGLPDDVASRLADMRPETYLGLAAELLEFAPEV